MKQRIYAIVLLGIMAVLVGHNLIPHSHNSHNASPHTHYKGHSHDHSHIHDQGHHAAHHHTTFPIDHVLDDGQEEHHDHEFHVHEFVRIETRIMTAEHSERHYSKFNPKLQSLLVSGAPEVLLHQFALFDTRLPNKTPSIPCLSRRGPPNTA